MFQLVMDVDRYHEFLPWCSGSRLLNKTEEFIDGEVVEEVTFSVR